MRLFQACVIVSLDGLCGKDAFIKIDDMVTIGFKVLDLGLDLQPPLLIALFLLWVNQLDLLDALCPDLVYMVDFPE